MKKKEAAVVQAAAREHRWSAKIFIIRPFTEKVCNPYLTVSIHKAINNQTGVSLTCPRICEKEVFTVT